MLDERQTRLYLGSEALYLGRGGVSQVAKASGKCRATITEGKKEIISNSFEKSDRIRSKGAGRPSVKSKHPHLIKTLEDMVSPVTRGDPESPLQWCCKSLRELSSCLKEKGFQLSHRVVGKLLKELGYSLQSTRKTKEGGQHPDRNAQFHHINDRVTHYLSEGYPAISVDCKKKELIGNYGNKGREWQPKGDPEEVKVYDFIDKTLGKAAPYGIYDIRKNQGWVNVGISSDTAEFAVNSIRSWWDRMGKSQYSSSSKLLITADGGGSNGVRNRLWKQQLQNFANDTGMTIELTHLPPGTSKWNKIEHRLFSHISMNWRGRPLTSLQTIVNLIGSTRTQKGLKVVAIIDENEYEKGIKISDEQMEKLRIERNPFHGEWNYIIKPNKL